MKTYAPKYYKEFKCIASKCRHNCCIGWDIDIDGDTLKKYKSANGEIGKKLKENIDQASDGASFILGKDGRCPFLDGQNLCEIYKTMGENSLCRICSEHPRFYNEYADCTEMGIGLCCEEAARLISQSKEPFELFETESNVLEEIFDKEEIHLFIKRNNLFEQIQDCDLTAFCKKIFEWSSFRIKTQNETAEFLLTLERLDEERDAKLENLKNGKEFGLYADESTLFIYRNLLTYFIYRHFVSLSLIYDEKAALFFCVFSVCVISCMPQNSTEEIADNARLYSAEIEYSDENIEKIIKYLFGKNSID